MRVHQQGEAMRAVTTTRTAVAAVCAAMAVAVTGGAGSAETLPSAAPSMKRRSWARGSKIPMNYYQWRFMLSLAAAQQAMTPG
jgi:hypothetical protein